MQLHPQNILTAAARACVIVYGLFKMIYLSLFLITFG